jgi:methionine-rich copper-binding protein CopC
MMSGNNDTIQICADRNNEVDESNETNNCLENVFETLDIQPPISSVNQISPYWHNASPITIMAIANDTNSGVANVTLWYRFSLDNSTWSDWISFDIDDSEPWSWDFNFSAGEGYYEFHSIANDTTGNNESAKSISEAFCAYETQSPTSSIDQISPYWRTISPLVISATVTDTGGSEASNVTLWYRFSNDNSTWSGWTLYEVDEAAPWMWEFNFSTGDKFYEFYSIAIDNANNMEDTPAIANAFCGYDTTPPIIMLNSPANNSIIQPGTVIDLGIIEDNLNIINYSIDNGADKTFSPPYDIDTSNWTDGMHSIEVHVDDKVGNIAVRSYIFTIDGTAPAIVSTMPDNNTVNAAIGTTIIMEFNESMERSSVESSISTSPTLNVSRYSWNSDNTTLTITFASNLTQNTAYIVTVDTDAKDVAGNSMSSAYSWVFTTWIDTNNEGIPGSEETPDWFRGTVLIIIILIVVLFAFYRKRV